MVTNSVLHWLVLKGLLKLSKPYYQLEGFPPDIPDKTGRTP